MSHHGHAADRGDDLQSPAYPGAGHENTDVSLRPLIVFVIALTVSLTVIMLALKVQFSFYQREQSPGQVTPIEPRLPELADGPAPQPKIQSAPQLDMDELRVLDQARLSKLDWVDRSKGTAVIPIEDAMKLVVERGLPARKAAGSTAEAQPAGETKPAQPADETKPTQSQPADETKPTAPGGEK